MRQKPLVIPVTSLTVDWNNLINTIKNVTTRSPIRPLESSNRPVGDYFSFIAALGVMSERLETISSINLRESLLEHLFFSFLVLITKDEYLEILRESSLNCLDNINAKDDDLIILLSGNGLQWKRACYTFCSTDYPFRVRYIFDVIVAYLEQLKVFNNFHKRELNDETFILIDN